MFVLNPIAVSSWSLHQTIGVSYPDSPAGGPKPEKRHGVTPLPLLDLPAELAAHGYSSMQLCHFHLPSREASYASEFQAALTESGVTLHALLIDDGDLTDPFEGARDAAWIAGWLETAEALGAAHARVIAGKQPYSPETLAASAERIRALADETSVRLETENWYGLLDTPAAVFELLDRLEGRLGLCADFGNWPRPRKYEDLGRIMPRAETCHAKLEFSAPGVLDEPDATLMLTMAGNSRFAGPFVLVNGGPGDSEWDSLDIQRKALQNYEP